MGQGGLQFRPHRCIQGLLDGLLFDQTLRCQAHAIGRQHTRHGMNQNLRHPQCISHCASVLPSCTTKTLQGIASNVIAPGHRNFLNGMCHLLNSDVNKAFGNFFWGFVAQLCKMCKVLLHHLRIQALIAFRTKDSGEIGSLQFTQL